MTTNDGGPAMPLPVPFHEEYRGLSLRDWFAGMAMQGVISRGLCMTSDFLTQDASVLAYAMADSMLKAREK